MANMADNNQLLQSGQNSTQEGPLPNIRIRSTVKRLSSKLTLHLKGLQWMYKDWQNRQARYGIRPSYSIDHQFNFYQCWNDRMRLTTDIKHNLCEILKLEPALATEEAGLERELEEIPKFMKSLEEEYEKFIAKVSCVHQKHADFRMFRSELKSKEIQFCKELLASADSTSAPFSIQLALTVEPHSFEDDTAVATEVIDDIAENNDAVNPCSKKRKLGD